jgi:poly-gamma-glutamate capsule biosynthesis protein CapA/YwtB (metallophosphatase superfamily)
MKISFIGDVCLARQIYRKHNNSNYQVVSSDIINFLKNSDYAIANLEAPICKTAETDGDHLSFKGSLSLLEQFTFVNYFSLSNNHINDCGTLGMQETIDSLNDLNIGHNGLYNSNYYPVEIISENEKIAIITCTDMMNIPFSNDNPYKTLHIDDEYLNQLIKKYKTENYFVILYAHVGILFSRFVNPPIRDIIHEKIDLGTDLIITAHSHCVGGKEVYNGKNIFHSLGDFVMDGGSYRRRQSVILNIEIKNNELKSYELTPVITNNQLETVFPSNKQKQKILASWSTVTQEIEKNKNNYEAFFKRQYKYEMISHTLSTLKFLLKTKGFGGMLRLVMKRYEEVFRMGKWFIKDRSKDRRDDDAIRKDRKKFSENDLYN